MRQSYLKEMKYIADVLNEVSEAKGSDELNMSQDDHRNTMIKHLDKARDLYEKHQNENDPEKKAKILSKSDKHFAKAVHHHNFTKKKGPSESENRMHKKWFDALSDAQKKHYLELHPKSTYAHGAA